MLKSLDSLKTKKTFSLDGAEITYFSLKEAEKTLGNLSRLPNALKILLENLLRHEDGRSVTLEDIKALAKWLDTKKSTREIAYYPGRVLMQDLTGVPAVVDLAALRDAFASMGGDPHRINPHIPVDLVIDHSVMVDQYASAQAFDYNVQEEYRRNKERYELFRWAQTSFKNFRVVPPGTGICHQVNLEYLGRVVWQDASQKDTLAYFDTVVGLDSHTTMINGLGILGWGVGGIEAEAALLGHPISMVIPEVVGVKLQGTLRPGATATDLVLTVTQLLRKHGVVGKFVEFYGNGLDHLSLADRATISNMAPEYGATCALFPIDPETINYLRFTGREEAHIALVEAYAKAQGLWRPSQKEEPIFTETLSLDLGTVEPSLAGPKRPQDRVPLQEMASSCRQILDEEKADPFLSIPLTLNKETYDLQNGDIVIAAITSCTNTSNPSVMIGAGLLARKALEKGLTAQPWIKTSLAPGSQVVSDYYEKSGLQKDLNALGFNLVGYGCTTCIGNSGPLHPEIAAAIQDNNLVVGAILSGNRNFEGRIHPQVKFSYLASPLLVVAYALTGTFRVNIARDPLGKDTHGEWVYLRDLWPTQEEVAQILKTSLTPTLFKKRYSNVFDGDQKWRSLDSAKSLVYNWSPQSTYIKAPPFLKDIPSSPSSPQKGIQNARILAVFGDSITTDHISPAASIKEDSPAGSYLLGKGVPVQDFNSYGSRRGNYEVMVRGTFANIRLVNEITPDKRGGYTKFFPEGKEMTIYDAALAYRQQETPLVIFAGKEYGTGSSRDWAAKGTSLLGVKALIAETFERIHRSNLAGMGVLPLTYAPGEDRKTLKLTGAETVTIGGLKDKLSPHQKLPLLIAYSDGKILETFVTCCLQTLDEVCYFENGGILPYVVRHLAQEIPTPR